jgi:hypothetical protein
MVENIGRQYSWETRKVSSEDFNSLKKFKSYLPVYSHVYHFDNNRPFYLTITVSIRNTSEEDMLYLLRADYYNTDGDFVKKYLKQPIYVKPLETIEYVISETNKEGGSGANFIFEWASINEKNAPLIEAVMISTNGQQGISFTTRSVLLEQ